MKKCHLCGSTKLTTYRKVDGWDLLLCPKCTLLQTNLSSKKNIRNVNRDIYGRSYVSSYIARKVELSKRFEKYLSIIEKYKKGGTILDIGCGLGFFVEVASKNNSAWDAYGIEMNTYLVQEANKTLSGKVSVGSLIHIPFRDNFFDCITCFDVLEHSVEINENLASIHNALKEDGIVIIQSPNYRSFMQYLVGSEWDWWALPDHLLHFSPDSLITALKNNSFKLLMLKTYEPLSDFIGNLKGFARKNILTKILFIICIPFILIGRYGAHKLGYGALVFAIAQKI